MDPTNPGISLQGSPDDPFVVAIIIVVGLIGLGCSFGSIYLTYKLPALHNGFGYICAAHSVAEAGVLVVFVLWSAPIILVDPTLGISVAGKIIGAFSYFCYFVTLYFLVIKSLNRFIAITSPIRYRRYFSDKNMKLIISFVYIAGFLHGIPFLIPECDYLFDARNYVWYFGETICAQNYSSYVDLIYGCCLLFLTIFMDACTFFYLHKNRKNMSVTTIRDNKEIRFFIQACLTSSLYGALIFCFHVLTNFATTKWEGFLASSLSWELTHTFNGLIIVLFNIRFREKTNVQVKSFISDTSRVPSPKPVFTASVT
ncbi:hypothetical protein FO519_006872 [Halicephalobus sp. NKZ332]|nr:hypothetical protein FO519_006872 [Halicephalobus sp. NKZ332]